MPIGGLSVGRDSSIVIFDYNSNAVVDFAVLKTFEPKPRNTQLDSKGLDGTNIFGVEPNGWDLRMTLDRGSSTLDRFFATLEAAYYGGQNILGQYVNHTIQEGDGSITIFQFIGVALMLGDAGAFTNGKYVNQELSGRAARRILKS